MPDGRPWDFDRGKSWYEQGLNELFDGNIKKLIHFYYQQISEMVTFQKIDIVAHFDLIKKFNAGHVFFNEDEKWYKDISFEALDTISKSGSIIEINTRGVLKKLNEEFYPSKALLKRCLELKIPICLSSDAHDPKDVMAYFPEACELLQAMGFNELHILDEQGWNPVSIL
jgi:histidinol-phosphatase (PHP family)